MPRRRGWAAALALAAALAGVVDVLLRMATIGVGAGLLASAQDPGKVLFHTVLLPLALYVLVCAWPSAVVAQAWRRSRALTVGLAAAVQLIALLFVAADARNGFCERRLWPSDYADPGLRGELLDARQRQWAQVDATAWDDARRAYDRALEKIGKDSPTCTAASALAASSLRARWSAVLSLGGAAFTALFIWLMTLHVAVRTRPTDQFFGAALVAVALVTPWLLLRVYSEWYINFGEFDFGDYEPLLPALVCAAVVIFLLFLVRQRQTPLVVTSAVISAVSAVAAGVGAFKPEWFRHAADLFADLGWSSLLMVYALILAAVVSFVWLQAAPASGRRD